MLYGGAALLITPNSNGRQMEAATDIAVPGIIAAFVGRKFGMSWGILAFITIAGIAAVGSRK